MDNHYYPNIKYYSAVDWLIERQMIHEGEWTGGFWHSYKLDTHSHPFIYHEITGYAVSLLINLYKQDNSAKMLELAILASNFLVSFQAKTDNKNVEGAFPFGIYPGRNNPIEERYYSFDTAMCASGLIDSYIACGLQQYLFSAISAADWLIQVMQNTDGSFRSCVDAMRGEFFQLRTFAGDGGCFHAKNAIALLKIAQITGKDAYRESARKVCDWVILLQDKDGAIWANKLKNLVFTHAHCYAVEGLLYAGYNLGESKYYKAALRAAQWLCRIQNRDGSFYRHYKIKKVGREKLDLLFPMKTIDATAQAIRIFIVIALIEKDNEFLEAAKRSINFLVGMQCYSSDTNADKGFYYQLRDSLGQRRFAPSLMTWCTQFAISSISMFNQREHYADFSIAIEEIF